MNYEEKYKNALRWIESIYPTLQSEQRMEAEGVFPELAESEDERIKRRIYNYINVTLDDNESIEKEKWLAWLEKQGEKKPTPAVELRLKIGDWVVVNNKHQSIYQVEKIEDGYYTIRHTHGGTFRVCILHDESLRLWTIQDAKDGDVLALNGEYFLYKEKKNSMTECYISHCFIDSAGTFRENGEFLPIERGNEVKPAIEGQRELLFAKMKEAGYKWDADKKELKKIEQEPAWSEMDETYSNHAFTAIKEYYSDDRGFKNPWREELLRWLKSLKDRVGCEVNCTTTKKE